MAKHSAQSAELAAQQHEKAATALFFADAIADAEDTNEYEIGTAEAQAERAAILATEMGGRTPTTKNAADAIAIGAFRAAAGYHNQAAAELRAAFPPTPPPIPEEAPTEPTPEERERFATEYDGWAATHEAAAKAHPEEAESRLRAAKECRQVAATHRFLATGNSTKTEPEAAEAPRFRTPAKTRAEAHKEAADTHEQAAKAYYHGHAEAAEFGRSAANQTDALSPRFAKQTARIREIATAYETMLAAQGTEEESQADEDYGDSLLGEYEPSDNHGWLALAHRMAADEALEADEDTRAEMPDTAFWTIAQESDGETLPWDTAYRTAKEAKEAVAAYRRELFEDDETEQAAPQWEEDAENRFVSEPTGCGVFFVTLVRL